MQPAPLYKGLAALTIITTLAIDSTHFSLLIQVQVLEVMMAAQQIAEEEQQMMNLTRLQTEVSDGTYRFTKPLTIVATATQDKYVVYISCSQCFKGVQRRNQGYYCPQHQWQRSPMYRYNLRVLLQDWIGTESWVSVFDAVAVKLLGFTANAYVAMTSDEERSRALSVLRGVRVKATIKKRNNNNYVNYNASELEVLDEVFSL